MFIIKNDELVQGNIHFDSGTRYHSYTITSWLSNHGDETKYDSTVVKMGGNANVVVTSTVVTLFLYVVESYWYFYFNWSDRKTFPEP